MRPDPKTESVNVMAYVLDRLYREHVDGSPLKVKEIECRIAELETRFLGQNIDYGPDSGSAAVRRQVGTVRRSKERSAIDAKLVVSFRTSREAVRRRDPGRSLAESKRFWKRLDRHTKAHDVWVERTTSKLDGNLRRAVANATHNDDLSEPLNEYVRETRIVLDLWKRWREEYGGHLDQMKPPDVDPVEYGKSMRKWMRRWEAVWEAV